MDLTCSPGLIPVINVGLCLCSQWLVLKEKKQLKNFVIKDMTLWIRDIYHPGDFIWTIKLEFPCPKNDRCHIY